MNTPFFIKCPHCSMSIEILELNCRIFRCGILKENFTQIDPHLPKEQCDELQKTEKIYGCGKPFRIDENDNVVICGYI